MTPTTLHRKLHDWRYTLAARLLGDQWYVPRTPKERAYIVVTAPMGGIGYATAIFPAKTIKLSITHDVPSLDDVPALDYTERKVGMVGSFSGTIGEPE